jgi:ribonuclease P protein subunit POP4
MPLTPDTLARHELNGLAVRVTAASNPDLVGTCGRVVRETTGTLHVRGADGRTRQVPKVGSTFAFALPGRVGESPAPGTGATANEAANAEADTDEAAGRRVAPGTASELPRETAGRSGQSRGCEGAAYVTVDGGRLYARPARRTETTGDDRWR